MVQAKQLMSVYGKYEHFYFTFAGGVAEQMKKNASVCTIPNIVRRNPVSWIIGAVLSVCLAFKEKPDIVISTGAGVVTFFCMFAKLFGSKLIFIESAARVETPTLTARFLYPFSDLFIVQWPALLNYFPRAKFLGRLA